MRTLNQLLGEEPALQAGPYDDQLGEARLIKNKDGLVLMLVKRPMKHKLTDQEKTDLACIQESFPVYILRGTNGDDYFSLSEWDDKELQPFANGSWKLIQDIIQGL